MPPSLVNASALPAMPRFGVIVNLRSGRNRKGTQALDALLASRPEIVVRRPTAPSDTEQALTELAAEGVDVLAVCGGDGTVQQVLNVVLEPRSPFRVVPPLAVLPGGTTNMIAHDVNDRRRPAAVLKRLLAHRDAGTLASRFVERPVMRLTGGDAPIPTYGLFFGAAGIYEATLENRRTVDAIGLRDGFGPGLRLLAVIGKVIRGRDPFGPTTIRLKVDGRDMGELPYVAVLASTMQTLALGLVPFWGRGTGKIRLTVAMAGSRSILRAIVLALRQRPHKLLTAANGYDSLNAERIELAFTGGCVLDGETFLASPSRPIILQNAGNLRFLSG